MQRHRLIMDILGEQLQQGVHALSIQVRLEFCSLSTRVLAIYDLDPKFTIIIYSKYIVFQL